MSRPKGNAKSDTAGAPDSIEYTTEERLELIASLIVEFIDKDVASGKSLFKKIHEEEHGSV